MPGAARLILPQELCWSLHRGETDPILGWYSQGLGRRTPAIMLLGSGLCWPGGSLTTRLVFHDAGLRAVSTASRRAVSWGGSAAELSAPQDIHAEAL